MGAHNFAVLAIMLQVCLVYTLSAMAKLNDPPWRLGLALGQTMQVRHYFTFYTGQLAVNELLVVFFNYVVVCYQVLFPFLVWVPLLKKPFLILGILMHLYISFIMGLLDFGIIMILGYVYFWPAKQRVS